MNREAPQAQKQSPDSRITRRTALLSAGAVSLAAASRGVETTAPATGTAQSPHGYKFRDDTDQTDLIHWPSLHEGKGAVDIKFFFRPDGAPKPALLLLYTIPPGASEGVDTHRPGDVKLV